jgi:hypothetical protein
MSVSDTYEDKVLDKLLGAVDFTPPANVEIALSQADPTDDGSGLAEPVGNNYSRVTVANTLTEWPASSGGSKANANEILFPAASGSWGTLTHYAIFEESGGMIFHGALTAPLAVSLGQQPKFAAGALTVTAN